MGQNEKIQIEIRRAKKQKKILAVVALVLLIGNIISWGLILYRNWYVGTNQFNNDYPLIDPFRSVIEQKHFFSTIQPLREQMRSIVNKYEQEGHEIGVYFEYINTGSNIAINEDHRFWPASLSKMPTVLAAMKKVEKGEWQMSNELVLLADDKDEKFGDLYKKPTGTRFTIEELIRETLVNSDNTSHRILVRNLSSTDYTDIFEALGMEQLFDDNYDINPKEYSRIFKSLYSASYLNRENSEKVLKWLTETSFDELWGSGVPDDVGFSHKIGEEFEQGVFLDSGIVYVPYRPYHFTVMIKTTGENEEVRFKKAQEIMKELSTSAYEYVNGN